MRRHLSWLDLFLLSLFSIGLHIIEVHSTGHVLYSRTRRNLFEQANRDGDLPIFPLETDLRLQSSHILKAHQVLRVGLQQFLEFKDLDLGTYLNYLIYKRTEPFKDEYGQVIRNYKKVFRFIWEQYNETLVQNYAIEQYNKDKLDLCSVARYLSHQPKVEQRGTIMKKMGDALQYRCHPCTPYTPKQWDLTVVPSTDGINQTEFSSEESLILCKEKLPELKDFDWKDGDKGEVKWAWDCDFSGSDIRQVNGKGEECGGLCIAESRCTHFTYGHGGICYLKSASKSTDIHSLKGAVCGYIIQRNSDFHWQNGNDGQVKWAHGCDFYGNDFSQYVNGSENCIIDCIADSRCTHFVWLEGYNSCNLKTVKNPAVTKLLDGYEGMCGFVVARV